MLLLLYYMYNIMYTEYIYHALYYIFFTLKHCCIYDKINIQSIMHTHNTQYTTVAKPASVTSGELPFRSSTLTSAGMKGLKASQLASLSLAMFAIAMRPSLATLHYQHLNFIYCLLSYSVLINICKLLLKPYLILIKSITIIIVTIITYNYY